MSKAGAAIRKADNVYVRFGDGNQVPAQVRGDVDREVHRHRAACGELCSIAQYGSTRSITAGVASGIAMHSWVRAQAGPPPG